MHTHTGAIIEIAAGEHGEDVAAVRARLEPEGLVDMEVDGLLAGFVVVARALTDPRLRLVVRVVQVGDGDEFVLARDRARLQASEAVTVNMKEAQYLAGHIVCPLAPDVDADVVVL